MEPLEGMAETIHCDAAIGVANLSENIFNPGLIDQNVALILLFLVLGSPFGDLLRRALNFT